MHRQILAAALSFAFAAAATAGPQQDDPHSVVCTAVRGMLVPECNAAICNQGTLTGDLKGRFFSRETSIYPAGSGWLASSWTRIELDDRKGRIETLDESTMPFDARRGPDESQRTEILSITEATGAYQDHFGTLVIAGAHGIGRATPYTGRICHKMAGT
jgi:hypothetical protein